MPLNLRAYIVNQQQPIVYDYDELLSCLFYEHSISFIYANELTV